MGSNSKQLERVLKYCRDLEEEYDRNYINSSKAAAYRHKILNILMEMDTEQDCPKAIAHFWKIAYYKPLTSVRNSDNIDNTWLSTIVGIFCGELHLQLAKNPCNAAVYYLHLGDLTRYIPDTFQCSPSFYYLKCIDADPEYGQAYNQLGIMNACPLQSIRFFVLALVAGRPFKNALDNLKKKVDDVELTGVEEIYIKVVKCLFFQSSKKELERAFVKLYESIIDEDPLNNDKLPVMLNTLVFASKACEAEMETGSVFTVLSKMYDIMMSLLKMVSSANLPELEEGPSTTRRRRNSSSGSESSNNEEEEDVIDCPSEERTTKLILWPLSVCREWLLLAFSIMKRLKEDEVNVPAVHSSNLATLSEKLINNLNGLPKLLETNMEECNEETGWLINGPEVLEEDRCMKQLGYWSTLLSNSSHSPIEFVGYFRLRRNVTSENVNKKMAELRLNCLSLQRDKQDDWIPLYVVVDYEVLVLHLGVLKKILATKMMMIVVPSFTLALLDKMKGTGPAVRGAMRFIEQKQLSSDLRVETSSTYTECCQKVADSLEENEGGLTTVVSLLVTNIEQYHTVNIKGVSVYHIDGFWDRLKKTMASHRNDI